MEFYFRPTSYWKANAKLADAPISALRARSNENLEKSSKSSPRRNPKAKNGNENTEYMKRRRLAMSVYGLRVDPLNYLKEGRK